MYMCSDLVLRKSVTGTDALLKAIGLFRLEFFENDCLGMVTDQELTKYLETLTIITELVPYLHQLVNRELSFNQNRDINDYTKILMGLENFVRANRFRKNKVSKCQIKRSSQYKEIVAEIFHVPNFTPHSSQKAFRTIYDEHQ